MNLLLIAAAATGLTLLHVFAGGKAIARPLLLSRDMHPVARLTNDDCWHGGALVLTGLAVAFLWAALGPAAWPVALFAAVLCMGFAGLGIVLVRVTGQKHRHMPQWMPCTGLAALALPGMAG